MNCIYLVPGCGSTPTRWTEHKLHLHRFNLLLLQVCLLLRNKHHQVPNKPTWGLARSSRISVLPGYRTCLHSAEEKPWSRTLVISYHSLNALTILLLLQFESGMTLSKVFLLYSELNTKSNLMSSLGKKQPSHCFDWLTEARFYSLEVRHRFATARDYMHTFAGLWWCIAQSQSIKAAICCFIVFVHCHHSGFEAKCYEVTVLRLNLKVLTSIWVSGAGLIVLYILIPSMSEQYNKTVIANSGTESKLSKYKACSV